MTNRRLFITKIATGVTLIPLASLTQDKVWAAAAKPIAEDHPMAIALGYLHDANATDTVKFPKRAGASGATQFCDNCNQYQATDPGWGTCGIFPNFLVAEKGWCNVWVSV